jgi:hypothetical protein
LHEAINYPDERIRSMNIDLQVLKSLSLKEKILSAVVLALVWGGIAVAMILSWLRIIDDPGTFFWGCIAGSFALAYLAVKKKKLDIVSLLTPVYGIIIFTCLDVTPNLLLQALYAASITALLIRIHQRFS